MTGQTNLLNVMIAKYVKDSLATVPSFQASETCHVPVSNPCVLSPSVCMEGFALINQMPIFLSELAYLVINIVVLFFFPTQMSQKIKSEA